MQELQNKINKLKQEIVGASQQINLVEIKKRLENLESLSKGENFWSDSKKAQSIMQEIGSLKQRVQVWDDTLNGVGELKELSDLGDEKMESELEQQYNKLSEKFKALKEELKFSGEHDSNDAILSIFAGAGGTDAQDWASMLQRMYIRYCENHNFKTDIVDQSAGDEAGIKSVTIEISGEFAYGLLKAEQGVHRLVRLSPFNSDNLRQTSFAKVDVLPKIESAKDLEIDEKDLKIDVFRAGGHGGQSVNTTDSAVRVTHVPTGIVVSIQNERSQLQNKETALTILRSKLVQLRIEQHQDTIKSLKGPNTSAEWGNQIRSYVLHPYKMVKDLRTKHETTDVSGVLDGKIDEFINEYLNQNLNEK
jgi:peptide chain release factor 2